MTKDRAVELSEATFGHSLGPGAVRKIALRKGREEVQYASLRWELTAVTRAIGDFFLVLSC